MTVAAPRIRVQRRPMHGVLLLDKPLGLSSNQALQKAKWLLRAEKAGHTGTLDPLATGVLPLCFGAATKFSALQLEAPKRYHAVALLGVTTSTGDAEGEVLSARPWTPPRSHPSVFKPWQGSSPAASNRCRPCTARSRKTARPCTNMPVRASRWNVRHATWRYLN